jgi:BirA family transcriptional regulator, biotin operon repressor / biotin---[acetyl-CoA-carboxylase] ligase
LRPLAFKLLTELSAAHFTSGVALAKKHNVSRSAISDAMKDATEAGVEIFSLTRRGYRLAAPIDLLDIDIVREAIGDKAHRFDVDIVPAVGSTNTELLARAAAGAAGGACLATEMQTAGRGRRGRVWQSRFASSLTFSLLWRFDKGASGLGGLSLVVGLALARALRTTGLKDAMLKWPNDVVVNGEKLAGILIETQGDMLGPTAAVIGIGVNVKLPPELKLSIDQPATDVASHLGSIKTRNHLLAAMLRELADVLDVFTERGFHFFKNEWLAFHALQEQAVTVRQRNAPDYDALVKDVGDDGSLVVEATDKPGSRQILTSAEISIRAAAKPTNAPRKAA